jgi:MFS transporter, DHA2 family, methylenomycin A resistance protein
VLGLAGAAALVPLSSTMIAVALPDLAADLDVGVGTAAVWLVGGYLVMAAVVQPVGGRLGDRVAHRRAFRGGLVGFIAASVAASVAPWFLALVAARVLQALAGAVMVPNAVALLRSLSPAERRGRTYGWFGTAMALGAAVGPVVGGGLVDGFGWRATFVVNLPCGLAALAAVRAERPVAAPPAAPATHGQARRHAALLLRRPAFVSAAATVFLHNLVMYSLLLLVPLFAERRLGLDAGSAGLLLAAMTAPMLVAGPVGGAVSDRLGRRAPVLAGGTLALAGLAGLLVALPDPPAAGLAALLAPVGLGIGLAAASVQASAVEAAPLDATGLAGGLHTMSRYAGGVTAAGLVASLGSGERFEPLAAVLVAAAAISVLTAWRLPTRARPRSPAPAGTLAP